MSAIIPTTEFQPYGFLLKPRTRKNGTPSGDFLAVSGGSSLEGPSLMISPVQESTRAPTPPSPTTLEASADIIAASEHGRHLGDKVEFVVIPTSLPQYYDAEYTQRARTLFAGQLRFETTAAEVRYLLQTLVGVSALKVDQRGPGCFVLYLASEAEEAHVRALNRRLLFDHNGVWFARTPEATEYLLDYVDNVMPTLKTHRRRALRLPRDSIVIEDSRTKRNMQSSPHARPALNFGGSPMDCHHQQPHGYYSASNYNACSYSQPATPYAGSSNTNYHQRAPRSPVAATGFHGSSVPEYVFGDYSTAPPPPPPYGATW